jgi:hypothetical protein
MVFISKIDQFYKIGRALDIDQRHRSQGTIINP